MPTKKKIKPPKQKGGPGGKGKGRSKGRNPRGKSKGKGKGKGNGAGAGKGKGKGKGRAEKKEKGERSSESQEGKPERKAGKAGAAAPREGKGEKRKFGAQSGDRPRKGPRNRSAAAEGEEKKKEKKPVGFKQKRRKEVTKLYSELINPGRTRKATLVVSEILALLRERSTSLAQYCSKEIGSRIVQACLKWGSREQRRELLTTLKEDIPKLSVDRYGHVVVLKLLRYIARTSAQRKPTEEEKKARVQNLREFLEGFHGKNLHAAFYHRNGCRVINGIYFSEAVGTKEKRRIFHDVAVPPAVALTRPELPGSLPLRQLLAAKDLAAEHRTAMVEHLREVAEKSVDKELLSFDIVHLVFQAFCEVATEAQLRDLAEKCMAGAPYLLSSKAGAEAVLRLLGVASAKQKKDFCRDLKGKYVALATNAVDFVVMMRLAATIDDTVLLSKTMLAEWTADLSALVFDKYGHKALAWVFRPDDKHLFSPYERNCVALPASTALKASETRRQELVRVLKGPLRAVLLEDPLKAAADMHAMHLLAAYMAADWDGELVEALVAAGAQDEALERLDDGTATTSLITLLKLQPAGAKADLAGPLWRRCLEPRLAAAATSRCAFVLLALLKSGGEVGGAVAAALRQRKKELEGAVKAAEKGGKKVEGAKQLLAAAEKPGSA